MSLWFVVLAVLGGWHIVHNPGVLRAISPYYAIQFFLHEHWVAFFALGTVVLCITGAEALYADMIAFQGLANVKEATIAMVAPGISEALIATAMGLFAAIPAVWAYNRFSTKLERIAVRYDTFVEEFSSILARQAHVDE